MCSSDLPPQAGPLMNVLNSRVFSGMRTGGTIEDSMYNDMPVYDDRHDEVVWEGRRGSAMGEGERDGFGRPNRSNTWQDDVYDRPTGFNSPSRSNTFASRGADDDYVYRDSPMGGDRKTGPGRPAAPKPNFGNKAASLNKNEAIAMYNFDADQPGDLGFKKGEVITVLKKTESDNDWW